MKLRAIEDTQTTNTQTTTPASSPVNEESTPSKFAAKFPSDIDSENSRYKSGVVMVCQNVTNRSYNNYLELRKEYASNTLSQGSAIDTMGVVLLPQSQVRVEAHQHNYDEDNESIVTYLNQKGWQSAVAQGMAGFVEKIFGTTLQDQTGEIMDRRRKSYYQGSASREYMYMNTFSFQSEQDLIEFAKIYEIFTKLGYPSTGEGMQKNIQDISNSVQGGLDAMGNKFNVENLGGKVLIPDIIASMSQFNTRKLPPVWFIKPFEFYRADDGSFNSQSRILPTTTYGPMALVSVRFDMTPDSIPKYFAQYPNDPVNVTVELRFKEMFEMKQEMIFDAEFIDWQNKQNPSGGTNSSGNGEVI